ncbi:type IV conjugative transfer system protein TraE [Croceicoccus mobilis]|uniref:Conjugal transfer protein TraE n=1 Tax=Croceicoccus mobilis TaxID=1703339 RepID=A0A916Z8Z9_9SPHN|nr:type IV conjugative transfer system protein TraE [Croceicoccus mobilis]GGD82207.1 hypothetical protein GCM10010990_35230 [Croceicoccus mobilis]
MDISIAHETSQRTLKQRNLLALACLVLGVLLVVMFVAANTRDREVILQPVIPQEMRISNGEVSPEYLEAVTRDAAQLALNRSPETLGYWVDSLVKITAPEDQGKLKSELMGIVANQEGSQVTQFVTIDWIRVDPENLTSKVGGVLHTVVGSRDVRQEHKIFQFNWKYTGLSLKLKGFGVVVRSEEDEG